jgi:hypothetical protein
MRSAGLKTSLDAGLTFTSSLLIEMSFRDGPKDQTRNLEIPGSSLRDAPE